MLRKLLYLTLVVVIIGITACEDRSSISAPPAPSTGEADFTKFMSIGNSLTAGYQSGALFEGAQRNSMGKLIAQQVGTAYVQPHYANPGFGNRKELQNLAPTIVDNPLNGELINGDLADSYNNLGVPGALLTDILLATDSTTCMAYQANGTANPYFSHVLRGKGTVLEQVMNSHPTFLTIWVGNNDVLGYATSGGTMQTGILTPMLEEELFRLQFNAMIDSILISNTKGVIATIPEVLDIPFFTTIGPKVGMGLSASLGIDHSIPLFYYQKNGETTATGLASINDLLMKSIALTLYGSTAASLVGDTTGAYYNGNAPSWVVTSAPFGLHPQNPWPDNLVLDADEIANVETYTDIYNSIITDAVNTNSSSFGLADMNAFISSIVDDYSEFGLQMNGDYITGGLFSLDGVHPTSRGYAILANKFIDVINTKFNAEIPMINVSTIEGSIILTD